MNGASQKKLSTRVKRIAGQVAGIQRMVEDETVLRGYPEPDCGRALGPGWPGYRAAYRASGELCVGAWQRLGTRKRKADDAAGTSRRSQNRAVAVSEVESGEHYVG